MRRQVRSGWKRLVPCRKCHAMVRRERLDDVIVLFPCRQCGYVCERNAPGIVVWDKRGAMVMIGGEQPPTFDKAKRGIRAFLSAVPQTKATIPSCAAIVANYLRALLLTCGTEVYLREVPEVVDLFLSACDRDGARDLGRDLLRAHVQIREAVDSLGPEEVAVLVEKVSRLVIPEGDLGPVQ